MLTAVVRAALGASAAMLFAAVPADAQVSIPDCAALASWGGSVDPADQLSLAPALDVPQAFADDRLKPVFGAGVLSWSQADAKAVSGAFARCHADAKKRRDKAAMDAYTAGNNQVKAISRTLAAIEKARNEAATRKATIDALADTLALDRALDILLAADLAKPNLQPLRALPQEVADPVWRLGATLPTLAHVERAPLFAALEERRRSIQAGLADELRQAVAAATADAEGLLALQEARQRLGEASPEQAQAADARMLEIREAMRAASPPVWTPPDCLDLYRWAGAEGSDRGVRVGLWQMQAAFADDRLVPVFGLPVADWSDETMARFATLRRICQTAWRALPEANTVNNPAPDAPELLRLASKGRWIDNADGRIAGARDAARNYRAAQDALQEALQQIAALPATAEGLSQLNQLRMGTDQSRLDQQQRTQLGNALENRRRQIAGQLVETAEKGLREVAVEKLEDLRALVASGNAALEQVPDPQGRQALVGAIQRTLAAAVLRLEPEFQARLDALPVSRDGLLETRPGIVEKLTGVSGTERLPAFQPYHAAARQRAAAIAASLREANCRLLHAELDISEKQAKQPVWGPGEPITLGELVCRLAESGIEVSAYDGGGMFSKTQTLKATLPVGGLQTISLHKGEVAAGKEMLVGFKMADANQEKTLSVEDWEMLMRTTGGQTVTASECNPVMTRPEKELKAHERMLAADCAFAAVRGRLF